MGSSKSMWSDVEYFMSSSLIVPDAHIGHCTFSGLVKKETQMKTYSIEILVPAATKYNEETKTNDEIRPAKRVYFEQGLFADPLADATPEDLKQKHREIIEAAGTEAAPVKFSEVAINTSPFCCS
jgi:hypothetical protein